MRRTFIITMCAAMAAATAPTRAADDPAISNDRQAEGQLADNARWRATVPPHWNGTLLLWSHGYGGALPASADDAPPAHRAKLLAAGYALAGSTYAEPGWAIRSAVPDQLDTVTAFTQRFGKPKRVIAWGMSMGGLVTTAIVERAPARVDAGLALCGSIGGAVGMMNMALDGAYAFRTLVAPDAGIRLVGTGDDRENAARVNAALAVAQASAQGRARVGLAAVLAGLPGWTSATGAQPAADDYAAQEAEMAKTFTMGVFLPRGDQERRGGGTFSWNDGVDYRAQLQRSGRTAMIRALYTAAGLDLDADLARLNAGTRITADPVAVRYMTDYYTPNGRPAVPLLAVQMIGDGLTSPSLQRAYGEAAAAAGKGALVRTLWVRGAGHCTFDTATVLASLALLGERLDKGRWPAAPAGFITYTPPPMLRPCVRGKRCS